jgi:hypothetical protein
VEHHKVADYWAKDGEDKRFDGYILTDDKSAKWLNQYPRASYGQVSDAANRQFNRDIKGLSKEQIKSLINDEENEPLVYELLSEHIGRILRGIEQLPHGHEKIPLLNKLLIATEEKARETFPGFKYEYVPIVFKSKDGTETSYPEIKHVVITFD